jgi:hypothetical protein
MMKMMTRMIVRRAGGAETMMMTTMMTGPGGSDVALCRTVAASS